MQIIVNFEILRKVREMIKFVIMMTLLMTVREVQLQRSPYAGSSNKFRGQPVNIVPVMSSLPSMENLPSTHTQARSIDLKTILTPSTPTQQLTPTTTQAQQPGRSTTVGRIAIPGRISSEVISNRNQDRDYDRDYDRHQHHHHHSHQHNYRGERDYDYNFYD